MGGLFKGILGGAAKVTNKIFGIDPNENEGAIKAAAEAQAAATREAADKAAAATRDAALAAQNQANLNAQQTNNQLAQQTAQQQLAAQIRDQTKPPETATVDLSGSSSEDDTINRRNPRSQFQSSGGSSTGIRLS
jgi:uncharacterized protein involved in exopolysaccharide biosynthesis